MYQTFTLKQLTDDMANLRLPHNLGFAQQPLMQILVWGLLMLFLHSSTDQDSSRPQCCSLLGTVSKWAEILIIHLPASLAISILFNKAPFPLLPTFWKQAAHCENKLINQASLLKQDSGLFLNNRPPLPPSQYMLGLSQKKRENSLL